MIKEILQSGYATYSSDGNKTLYYLSKIPGVNLQKNYGKKTGTIIFGLLGRFIYELLKRIVFVALFLFLPKVLFAKYMDAGVNGFGTEDCFVYFAVVMFCFCGSISNSVIFKKDVNAYTALFNFRCDPKSYFRFAIIRRSIIEFFTFWIALTVFGMNFVKALYLAIIIVEARFVGDTINIFIFRITKKSFNEISTGHVVLMLVSLFFAYFIPYLRGYVPGAYDLIFDTLWLAVILIVGAFFIYYVLTYSGYRKIAETVFCSIGDYEKNGAPEMDNASKTTPELIDEVINSEMEKNSINYERLNGAFFSENKSKITRGIVGRCLIILTVMAVGLIVSRLGKNDIICKVISNSMPLMVFVVFMFTSSDGICKSLYYQCDSRLFAYDYYSNKNDIMENFFVRLRYLIVIDMIPNVVLASAYAIVAFACGVEGALETAGFLSVGILLLSIFFTLLNMFVYYVIQPYRSDVSKSNRRYTLISIIIYISCAMAIYISIETDKFALVTGLMVGVLLPVLTTCVLQAGTKTFRNK